jgi:uncharacterized membrane protein YeaQ/YmgE (transglycosylase-associated protein family)
MLKKVLFLGLTSGILAGIASLVYSKIYTEALGADFSQIVNPMGVMISCLLGCVLAAFGYLLFNRWKNTGEIIFNWLFSLLTFASILSPFAAQLPLEIDFPELFPGLTVPMHFFPLVAWFTVKPMFIRNK